ncbi:MAG: polyamine aminopropyltransferase [Thermoproteota archaeon]|jgi:spermidine synthase|nr:polyamine aminopropyltransferase [Thermoproteota archaeon]
MNVNYFYQPVSSITKLAVGLKEILVNAKTNYQHVIIAELYEYGLSLILDDLIQVAEADEAFYHEALVHPALFLHGDPKKVLIIGGGDGCAAREVLKHNVELIKLVDIDGELVELCKKYLKRINQGALENEKVEVIIMDGKEFIEKENQIYDIIILDLTDPFGPEISKELYSEKFYNKIKRILDSDGILVTQAGTAFYYTEVYDSVLNNLKNVFKFVKDYENWIPSFGYSCCFILASDKHDVRHINEDVLEERIKRKKIELRFYSKDTHISLFKRRITRNLISSIF